ncbi:MAG: trypsin-like peptidase domain-containing protein [Phycisphaerae bacterium]
MKARVIVGALGATVVCWTLAERSMAAEPLKRPIRNGGSTAVDTAPESADGPATVRTTFEEVEILLDGTVGMEDIRALPQAPEGPFEELTNPDRVVIQVPTKVARRLVKRGANIRTLRKFVLVEPAGADVYTGDSKDALTPCIGDYRYGSSDLNVDIPDADILEPGEWVGCGIPISGAPAASSVDCIDVHYEIVHTYIEDLDVDLNDYGLYCWVDLWGPYQGSGANLNQTVTGIVGCNGLPVNQTWVLWAQDVQQFDTGYIDYWWIKVYYSGGGGDADLVIQSSSRSPATGVNPGDPIDLADTVKNQGTGAAGSEFWVTWFISEDSNVTTSDFEWAYHQVPCCLGPGATSSAAGAVPWPDVAPYNTPGQTYYIAVMADDTNEVGESNEDNNWGDVWPVTLAEGGCCDPVMSRGDRARLLMDNPGGAQNLFSGHCGTVVCCDSDEPDLPILVSWDHWGKGGNNDSRCDEPAAAFPEDSGLWMACDQIVHDAGCGPCAPPPPPANPMPPHEATNVPLDTELCWNVEPQTAKIIYGPDNRLDVYEVSDPGLLAAADSTVALVSTSILVDNGNGTYSLPATPTFTELILYYLGYPLCPTEPFADQPIPAFCSGALVGEDLVATAGHCIVDAAECAGTAFVFGYEMLDATTPVLTFPASDVYFCDAIVQRVQDPVGPDWGIIQLDRPVTGHDPLPARCTNKVANGQSLVMIGHPVGLPTKIAGGATTVVRDNSPPAYFQANVDAYGGNSGSAVFNAANLQIEGLLVRGNADWAFVGDCFASNWCPDTGCVDTPSRWEHVTRATEFAHLIPLCVEPEYDVYFGPCGAMALVTTTLDTCWTPPQLEPNTEYCWQIVARSYCGETTGPVWSFTTGDLPSIVSTDPPNCAIDARQPSDSDGSDPDGWRQIEITFDCTTASLPDLDFTARVEPGGTPVDVVAAISGTYTVTVALDPPPDTIVEPGVWTCFTYHGQDRCLGYLPADVNWSRTSDASDVLSVIDCLNEVAPCEMWQCDADRSDLCAPADILRVIDLLNGADAYDPWLEKSLPDCPSAP